MLGRRPKKDEALILLKAKFWSEVGGRDSGSSQGTHILQPAPSCYNSHCFQVFMAHDMKNRSGRKQPKQARSQVTVEAILDGTIQVFDREGPEAVTTTRIAEVAGVSVGTLYQYFENREAIIDALQQREFARADQMLKTQLANSNFASEHDLARAIITGLLGLYRAAPGLHRVLAIDGLHIGPTRSVQDFDRRMIEILRGFFAVTSFRISRTNHHAAAFVLYHSTRAVLLAAILEDSFSMSDEMLVSEVTDMVVRHLVGA
jgi:AcrR family transcriptional regulator